MVPAGYTYRFAKIDAFLEHGRGCRDRSRLWNDSRNPVKLQSEIRA
jgi:hypothetical protein